MRLALITRIGGWSAGAGIVLGVGGTATWLRGHGKAPWQEPVSAIAYAPALLGVGAATLGASLLALHGKRQVAAPLIVGGLATGAGIIAGTVIVHAVAHPAKAVLRDDQLPKPDPVKSKQLAQGLLASLNRDAGSLVIWVPGTGLKRMPTGIESGVARHFDDDVSLAKFESHMDYDVLQDTADTAEALRIVLRALDADRKPGQRILLAGESQGAWSITTVLQDPRLAAVVERVALTGNPGMNEHQYDGATTGKVRDYSNPGDAVAQDYVGDADMMLDGGIRMMNGEPLQGWRLVGTLANNAPQARSALTSAIRIGMRHDFAHDPHNYANRYDELTAYLGGSGGDVQISPPAR